MGAIFSLWFDLPGHRTHDLTISEWTMRLSFTTLPFFCILIVFIFTDVKKTICQDQVDDQQVKKVFGEDNTGCENPTEQEGIMDFAEMEIAEQLTQIDSVRNKSDTEIPFVFIVKH